MRMENLLSHQNTFIEKIFNTLENNQYIIATGVSGCGKTFSFQYVKENIVKYGYEQSIILDGDFLDEDQDYAPFKKILFSSRKVAGQYLKQGVIEVSKDIPLVGNSVSFLFSCLLNPIKNTDKSFFNDEEQVYINRLKKLSSHKKTCVICDNVHWWDHRSLKFLIKILTSNNDAFDNIKFIISVTLNQENNSIIADISKLTTTNLVEFPRFEYEEFKNHIFKKTQSKLNDSQIQLLYELVDGHLKVYFEVISEIKSNSFDFDAKYENNKKYLTDLLNRRLQECGASGEQIMEVLEYASIIGIKFSSFELQQLTEYTKSRLKKVIEDASNLKLTESGNEIGEYKFAHDIVREIFKTRVEENHLDYYCTMSLCLKEISPSQYYRRAKYMILAQNHQFAETLLCLEIISQLRTYGNISDSVLNTAKELFQESTDEYIFYMTEAYTAYNGQKYDVALKKLDLILSFYPKELLAERDILKLRCFSKKLASKSIVEATNKLNSKCNLENFNGEKDVYERYAHALITAYAHLGELDKSRDLEENVLSSLSGRINFDESAKLRLNTIKRNANAIHEIDTAAIFVQQATNFFGETDCNGEYIHIKQYYTSLTNNSAMLIKHGDFSNAYDETIKALSLERDNLDIAFSRTQIVRSNCIVAGVLCGKLKPTDAIKLYKSMLVDLHGILAEKLFYTSNLSIMYALNNEPDIALHVLLNEVQYHNVKSDREGIYRYRVDTNCAIYNYLLGNTDEAIAIIKGQKNNLLSLINGSYFNKKNDVILELMEKSYVATGESWLSAVESSCPHFQGKAWRYFGKGYAFAALCDWGI